MLLYKSHTSPVQFHQTDSLCQTLIKKPEKKVKTTSTEIDLLLHSVFLGRLVTNYKVIITYKLSSVKVKTKLYLTDTCNLLTVCPTNLMVLLKLYTLSIEVVIMITNKSDVLDYGCYLP